MAFRRSVAARAKFLYQQQQQQLAVPFSRTDRDDDDRLRRHTLPTHYRDSDYLRRRDNVGRLFGDRRFAIPSGLGQGFVRNMSSFGVSEKAVEAVAPVATVAGPVEAIQYLIDNVHTFTGLNWWGSIVVATVLMRTLLLPITIYQTKATYKYSPIFDQVWEIRREKKSHGKSRVDVAVCEARMRTLLNENGVKPIINWASCIMMVSVITPFALAINSMSQKMVSFKDGGAFWFADLTTPDATFILPALATFTFWSALKCHDGPNEDHHVVSHVSRLVFAALTIPIAASAPKAMLCYWITSNLYGLAYAMAINQPEVKKMLGVPNVAHSDVCDEKLMITPPAFGEWQPPLFVFVLWICKCY